MSGDMQRDRERTVYVNENPIGETEVYHANKHHVTNLKRYSDRYVKETTAQAALSEGLRPCKRCFPGKSGRHCPTCGHPPGDGYDTGKADVREYDCPNPDCRTQVFSAVGPDRQEADP